MIPLRPACAALLSMAAPLMMAGTAPPAPQSPTQIIAQAPAAAWHDVQPDDLLIMDISDGRRIIIQLAPALSPVFIANIQKLATARWWDGAAINRVQDNYVVQWGDPTRKKPLPRDVIADLPQHYAVPRTSLGAISLLPFPDSYAPQVGFSNGWPVAMEGETAWLPHCYGHVGVGRENSPDAGSGAELYAVNGHAPRQLDLNVAVVGRVLEGMEHLSSLPRGTAEMSFYADPKEYVPIISIRLASQLPERDRPRFQVMDTASDSFSAYWKARASRQDAFFIHPAGGIDICNIPVPVRKRP